MKDAAKPWIKGEETQRLKLLAEAARWKEQAIRLMALLDAEKRISKEMLEALDIVEGCLLWNKQDEASQEVMRRVRAVRQKAGDSK